MLRRASGAERVTADGNFSAGLDRMDRLVTQMLALSKVETRLNSGNDAPFNQNVNWIAVAEDAISDCLALADRRHIEIACEWPVAPAKALRMKGEQHLLTVMLRNLLDNAVRYAPVGTLVTLRFAERAMSVENAGRSLDSSQIARLGQRFYRPDGQQESGTGLGVSIITRIAELHGMRVSFEPRDGGTDNGGMKAVLSFRAD